MLNRYQFLLLYYYQYQQPMTTEETFLTSIKKVFNTYKTMGEKTFAQLNDEQILYTPNEDTNSVAIIVKHLHGNMLSRWTNFLTEDGEKEWRHRDNEFVNTIKNKEELLKVWEEGWECVFNVLNPLTGDDLLKTVYIRKEPHTVLDAITRQIAHYSYHVGQIVYMAKIIKSADWETLSIARNQSKEFNQKMMG